MDNKFLSGLINCFIEKAVQDGIEIKRLNQLSLSYQEMAHGLQDKIHDQGSLGDRFNKLSEDYNQLQFKCDDLERANQRLEKEKEQAEKKSNEYADLSQTRLESLHNIVKELNELKEKKASESTN